jgi:hypothetical protein
MKLVYRFKTQLRRMYRNTTAASRQGIPHSPVNLLSQTVNKSTVLSLPLDICQNWSLQLLYSVNVIQCTQSKPKTSYVHLLLENGTD